MRVGTGRQQGDGSRGDDGGSGDDRSNGAGRIYWVGGSKGGVGKSMMTVEMLDHLLEGGTKGLLVECDTANLDVWKAYPEQVETELVNLEEADGWITSSTRATPTARASW